MRYIFGIIVLLLLAQVQGASANFTISDDKFLVDANGTRIFMVGMYDICSSSYDDLYGYESCATSISKISNYTYSTHFGGDENYWNMQATLFNISNVYYDVPTPNAWIIGSHVNDKYFIGYQQEPNEPSTPAEYDALYVLYNDMRATDINHPVFVSTWDYKPANTTYTAADVADIVIDALYSYETTCGYDDRFQNMWSTPVACVGLGYWLDDFLFAKEREMRKNMLTDMGVTSIEQLPDPLWTIFEAYGVNWNEGSGNTTRHWKVVPENKLRAMYYWAVTVGYTGITPWGYKIFNGDGTYTYGLVLNSTISTYYNNLAGEFNSPKMQDALTLPTINFSWNYYTTWDNKVNFSTNPTRFAWGAETGTGYALTYRLKHNTTSNKYYLFVANKLNVSVSPTITIQGLTGTHTATTLGITGTGSSAPGRVLTLTNGVFSETLDAYAGIVYEIAESGNNSIPPVLSSCSATNTSNSVNVSCTGGSGNVTNSIRVYNVNTSTWNNVSTMYALNSGLNSGTAYTFRAYPYNNSGTGTINNTYTTVLGTTTQAANATTFTIKGSGGDATWSSFIKDNLTQNYGTNYLELRQYVDNYTSYWRGEGSTLDDNQTSANDGTLQGDMGYAIGGYGQVFNFTGTDDMMSTTTLINESSLRRFSITFKFNTTTSTGGYLVGFGESQVTGGGNMDRLTYMSNNGKVNFGICDDDGVCPSVISSSVSYNDGNDHYVTATFVDGIGQKLYVDKVLVNSSNVPNAQLFYSGYWKMGFDNIQYWTNPPTSNYFIGKIWDVRIYPREITNAEHNQTMNQTKYITGNFTSWYNWTDGNVTYQVVVNATTPANTNYSILYRQNNTGDYVSLASSQTGNNTFSISNQYQNTDVRIVLNGNETVTPELIAVTYYAQALATYAPNITSWSNTKTNNATSNITVNASESVTFNATANQTITTWNWFVNGTNQNINYDNISLSYPTSGTRLIQINATNSNGTSNTISWNLTVQIPDTSTQWVYGIGGKFFQNNTIGSNNSCINQGDGAIGTNCIFADNFNDNNYNGWFINNSGTWTPNNGVINQTGEKGYLVYNLTHNDVGVFIKFKEYGILSSYMDVLRMRGNTSTNYQLSMGSPTQTRASQYYFIYPDYWGVINNTVTKQRYLLDSNYVYNAIYGTNLNTYHSNISYASAMTIPLVIGSNSSLVSGTQIAFGGLINTATIVSWDEIRAVNLSASGEQNIQGNYSMNYTVPSSQYAKNITINGSYPSGTNYSLKYRQNATGDYIAVEGIKTANATIELPTPYYQSIDIQLEMNGSTTDTLWITNITIGTSVPSNEVYIPPTPIIGIVTTGNFWKNITWNAGSGNITDSYNISRNGTWTNSTTILFKNSTTVPHGWINDSIYAYNNSGSGTLNQTPLNNNTQIPNNIPIQSAIGNKNVNEGVLLSFSITGSDADSDTITCSGNNTKGTLTNCDYSWTPTYTDSGVYYWIFYYNDSYGGSDNEVITVTVNNVDTNTTPSITNVVNGTVGDTWGLVNFTVNQSDALTHVKYSTDSSLSSKTTNQTTGLNRSVNITGLLNGTKYYYSVFAYNLTNIIHWSNSTIQNFTTNSNVSANLVNFSFTNISNSESQIYQSSQSTVIKVDVNDSDGYITGVDVGITFLGIEINHAMSGGNNTWTYSFISGVVGTYYITHFYATDNSSGTNSTTSNLSFSVVPVISGGGGGGSSFVPTPTPTSIPTNKTNITLPVIVLPKQDKLMEAMNSKEAVIGGFIILGMLMIVSFRSKGR